MLLMLLETMENLKYETRLRFTWGYKKKKKKIKINKIITII